ncbi:Phytochelatin synthase [Novymonas esmeraldas]|uniref:Phytochelatin synthase n=1 Tax=Novymonas esmeraldas TaxID=1808958 RepID=A0AAW0ERQ4_9TRYP
MGSGPSVQEHLQKWETALGELEQLSSANRRLIEQDRIYGSGGGAANDVQRAADDEAVSERGGGRRPSSLVSFNPTAPAGPPPDGGMGVSAGNLHRQMRSGASMATTVPPAESRTGFGFMVYNDAPGTNMVTNLNAVHNGGGGGGGVAGNAPNDITNRSVGSASAGQQQPKHTRQQVLEIRKARTNLFRSYEAENPDALTDLMPCSHFGAVAVALSYLLGGDANCKDRRRRVTLEDIFFATQSPLHMLHSGSPHLPTMADIIREFLDVDNRFKGDYSLEVVHLDVSPTMGQVELGPNEVGDRQTRMQLPEFQRLITQDCEEETQAIRIVNYDPYVLEQAMLVDAFEDEDELNSTLATSVLGPNPHHVERLYSPRNEGAYAAVVDVRNAVQLMVTIAEGVVNDTLHVKVKEVPVASLFKAMMTAKEGHRARGFIRVFKKELHPEFTTDEIKTFWTPELCSGKVLGTTQLGTHALAISHHISPHIVGVAWAMHLLAGVRPGTHGYGNGLPVSDIIRTMKLPAEVFVDGVLPLEQVYEYAAGYVQRSKRDMNVRLYPVLTKIFREDAVPTISVFDLESILISVKDANADPECPEHVMVIMYNACVAHNVLYIVEEPQWCVLAGYDQEMQTAVLIDAHPKTFSRTWSCPLDRLHKAMTGNGYLMFSKGATSPTLRRVGAPATMAPTVESRLELVERQHELRSAWEGGGVVAMPKPFTFPSLPVMPTMVAMACTRLGLPTTFDDVVQRLPFEISALVIRNLTLEIMHVCLTQYLRVAGLQDEVYVTSYHGESNIDEVLVLQPPLLQELIQTSLDGQHVLLLHFDPSSLLVNGASHPFGTLGMVVGYDAELRSVRVADTNPNSFLREWSAPLLEVFESVLDSDVTRKHRTRGVLRISRVAAGGGGGGGSGSSAGPVFAPACSRPFRLDLLPVLNAFLVSPSPHFQGMSFAFSQLGYYYSPEEIFYEAYLKTMDDQRRRGSQAFAWRDVEVSLSVINKKIDASFMAEGCRKFLESRNAHRSDSQETISIQVLEDVDVDEELDELLDKSTKSSDTVILLNYDVLRTHHLPNLGRSVATVKSYDREKQLVELWDAEYAVFGLSFVVTKQQLIEMGDLENVGSSPYGFVQFKRVAAGIAPKKKLGLMSAPSTLEEEAELEAAAAAAAAAATAANVKKR